MVLLLMLAMMQKTKLQLCRRTKALGCCWCCRCSHLVSQSLSPQWTRLLALNYYTNFSLALQRDVAKLRNWTENTTQTKTYKYVSFSSYSLSVVLSSVNRSLFLVLVGRRSSPSSSYFHNHFCISVIFESLIVFFCFRLSFLKKCCSISCFLFFPYFY